MNSFFKQNPMIGAAFNAAQKSGRTNAPVQAMGATFDTRAQNPMQNILLAGQQRANNIGPAQLASFYGSPDRGQMRQQQDPQAIRSLIINHFMNQGRR